VEPWECLLGYTGLQLLFGMLPGAANLATPKLDTTVQFALFISLLTGFVFGTIPAMKASRSLADAVKEEVRTTARSRERVTVANALPRRSRCIFLGSVESHDDQSNLSSYSVPPSVDGLAAATVLSNGSSR
jgi:hypothetical protein